VAICERFDTNVGKNWERLPDMRAPRSKCQALAIEGRILVVDGLESPEAKSVQKRKSVAATRKSMGAAVTTFEADAEPLPRCEQFDPESQSWSKRMIDPTAPNVTAVAMVRGRLYMAGLVKPAKKDGGSKAGPLICEYFYLATGMRGEEFQPPPLADVPLKDLAGATSFQHQLYLFGQQMKQVCILNVDDGVWEPVNLGAQLPLRMRTIKIANAGLLCLGQFMNRDGGRKPEGDKEGDKESDPSRRRDPVAVPGQPWVLLPPYQVGRMGAAIVLVKS